MAKRGKGGGTYAHHIIAFDFAMWLSVEFRLTVYIEYTNGKQHKQNWDIKRILAANNFKIMTDAIQEAYNVPKAYHFSNEALMINEIVFGSREKENRDTATEEQLNDIASLEGDNATLIKLGMSYQERKIKLTEFYNSYKQKLIVSETEN
jgi:hypothetical protein